ncbi:MAG: polyprenol monophosphomannose synthase [Candidatus Cloacimonadia bacterium]
MKKALIIIPTYNEAENISSLIPAVLKQNKMVEVLVVDDNSPDGTGEIVSTLAEKNPRVHLLDRPGKMGLGSAYIKGFKYALEHGYEYVIEMDADFSHNPSDIPRLLDEIKDYDLVIGSRYVTGVNVVNWPIRRLLLSILASRYVRFITRMPVKDPTSGFKCIRRAVLESLDFDNIMSDGYSFQIEIHYKIWKSGWRIKEIPIVFTERRDGKSKMSKRIVWEAIFTVWKLRFFPIFWEWRTRKKRDNA